MFLFVRPDLWFLSALPFCMFDDELNFAFLFNASVDVISSRDEKISQASVDNVASLKQIANSLVAEKFTFTNLV